MASERVWVQCGGIGVSVPEDDGLTTAGELLIRNEDVNVASIHESDCGLARSVLEPGGGICSCEPFMIGLPEHAQ